MRSSWPLSSQGWLETTRGRGGGLRLLRPAAEVRLGDVVRQTESDFNLVECFDPERNTCRINGHCQLKGVLHSALAAYLAVLDGVTLADLVVPGPARGAKVQGPGLPRRPRPRAN